MEQLTLPNRMPRRRFLALAVGGTAVALTGVACGSDDDAPAATRTSPLPATQASGASQGTVVVGDVLDHALASDDWSGDFGFVTFKLHHGLVDGEDAYFIRTDASDEGFAKSEGLVHVPLMAKATEGEGDGLAAIYLFEEAPGQLPVLSTAPHLPDYSPAFRLHRVRGESAQSRFESVAEVEAAASAGEVTIEQTGIVVNYPVVKWPGGELPVDTERTVYLGDGQLLEPVDVAGEKVTFKLHACYPASRYIVTDVTIPEMATGMNIAPAPGAAGLTAAGATAKILVFGNGLEGSGPMGFQKSVTDTSVGDPAWSPYWDHYTFLWTESAEPTLLKSESAILGAEQSRTLERFPGTPDTNGTLFMVNCPVPVLAPVG